MKKLFAILLATAAFACIAPTPATGQTANTAINVTKASVPTTNQYVIQAAETKVNGPIYAEAGTVIDSGQGIKFKLLSTGAVTSAAPFIRSGSGTPESVITAPVGSLWIRTNGGTSTTFYVKETGTGNTGWIAK